MPAVNHTISVLPIGLTGIVLRDRKRPRGKPPQPLNRVSIIASFSRNKRTETSQPSRPLIPNKKDIRRTVPSAGGIRYMTLWDNNPDNIEHNEIILETNLHHKSRRNSNFEPKSFEVVVGLMRDDTTLVLGVSVLNISGPTEHEMDFDLPLCPLGMESTQEVRSSDESVGVSSYVRNDRNDGPGWTMDPLQFEEEMGRGYLLAKDASMRVRIKVLDTDTFYEEKMRGLDERKNGIVMGGDARSMGTETMNEGTINDEDYDPINNQNDQYDPVADDYSDVSSVSRHMNAMKRNARGQRPPRPSRLNPSQGNLMPHQRNTMNQESGSVFDGISAYQGDALTIFDDGATNPFAHDNGVSEFSIYGDNGQSTVGENDTAYIDDAATANYSNFSLGDGGSVYGNTVDDNFTIGRSEVGSVYENDNASNYDDFTLADGSVRDPDQIYENEMDPFSDTHSNVHSVAQSGISYVDGDAFTINMDDNAPHSDARSNIHSMVDSRSAYGYNKEDGDAFTNNMDYDDANSGIHSNVHSMADSRSGFGYNTGGGDAFTNNMEDNGHYNDAHSAVHSNIHSMVDSRNDYDHNAGDGDAFTNNMNYNDAHSGVHSMNGYGNSTVNGDAFATDMNPNDPHSDAYSNVQSMVQSENGYNSNLADPRYIPEENYGTNSAFDNNNHDFKDGQSLGGFFNNLTPTPQTQYMQEQIDMGAAYDDVHTNARDNYNDIQSHDARFMQDFRSVHRNKEQLDDDDQSRKSWNPFGKGRSKSKSRSKSRQRRPPRPNTAESNPSSQDQSRMTRASRGRNKQRPSTSESDPSSRDQSLVSKVSRGRDKQRPGTPESNASSLDQSRVSRVSKSRRRSRSKKSSSRRRSKSRQPQPSEDESSDQTDYTKETNKKPVYSKFMNGFFGGRREEDEDEDSGSDESQSISPPHSVKMGDDYNSFAARTELTNFSQDSYEKYEKKSMVPVAFGGNGIFGFTRPTSKQRSIQEIPSRDEYTTIGKVESMHRSRSKKYKQRAESRDDSVSYDTHGDDHTEYTGNDSASRYSRRRR